MEKEQYRPWCSMTPLVCSIVPIGAAGLIGLFVLTFPADSNCFGLPNSMDDAMKFLIPCCTAPLIALVAVPMGIFSILSGMAEIRVPYSKGKTLVAIAIVFGILDIAVGVGFLWYLFGAFSKVFF